MISLRNGKINTLHPQFILPFYMVYFILNSAIQDSTNWMNESEKGIIIEADISDKKDIEDSIDIDLLKEYLEEIMLYDTFSYGFYNIKNKVYDLKIKTPNKTRSKDKLGCRICNSNDYKKSDVQEYIINSVDDNVDFKKIKTKIDMCNYIELILRYKTKIESKNCYINIDNIHPIRL